MSDGSYAQYLRSAERKSLLKAIDAVGAELRELAIVKWRNACPCCNGMMSTKPPKQGLPTPRHYRTMGHNAPVGLGGRVDQWIYICHGCNNEQGSKTYEQWAACLPDYDPRKPRIAEVGRFFRANGEQS